MCVRSVHFYLRKMLDKTWMTKHLRCRGTPGTSKALYVEFKSFLVKSDNT